MIEPRSTCAPSLGRRRGERPCESIPFGPGFAAKLKRIPNAEGGSSAQRLVPSQKPLRQIRYLLCRSGRARACREWRPRDVVHLPADNGTAGKGTVRKSRGDGASNRAVGVGDRTPDQLGNAGKRHNPRPAAVGLRVAASAGARRRQGHSARRGGQRATAAHARRGRSLQAISITRATPGSRQRKVARSGSRPVYFDGPDPFMSIAMPHSGRDAGSTVAEINLKFLSSFINPEQIGTDNEAYIVGPAGRLLAHSATIPRLGTNLADLPQVAAAIRSDAEPVIFGQDPDGSSVLTASADGPTDELVRLFRATAEQGASAGLQSAVPHRVAAGAGRAPGRAGRHASGAQEWSFRFAHCRSVRSNWRRASSAIASRCRRRTKSRIWPTISTAWQTSCRGPTAGWSRKSPSARAILRSLSAS